MSSKEIMASNCESDVESNDQADVASNDQSDETSDDASNVTSDDASNVAANHASNVTRDVAPNGIPAALSNSAGFLLNRAARLIREMNSEALKPTGLSLRDLGILRIVSSEGPLSQQALSERHRTDRSTIVEIVDQLEMRRLVVRLSNEKDRRSYLVTITPRGEKALARANRLTRKEQQKYLSALSEEEWQALRSTLVRLISFHEGRSASDPVQQT